MRTSNSLSTSRNVRNNSWPDLRKITAVRPAIDASRVQILNQITESHRVIDLAKMVADIMGADIAYLPNPRREADENDLIVRNDQFLALGLPVLHGGRIVETGTHEELLTLNGYYTDLYNKQLLEEELAEVS